MSFWGEFNCPKWLLENGELKRGELDGILKEGELICKVGGLKGMQKMRANRRIGPHNKDVISIMVGSLLGDGYAERRRGGIRLTIQQESSNVAYIMWFHKNLAERGYCKEDKPKRGMRIGKGGKVRYFYRLRTYTYKSLGWLYDIIYDGKKKVITKEIKEYINPLSLSIWIMNDGGRVSAGMKLSTNGFTREEVEILSGILNEKYGLDTRLHRDREKALIYVPKGSMGKLAGIVKGYIHPTMKYKLNGHLLAKQDKDVLEDNYSYSISKEKSSNTCANGQRETFYLKTVGR